MVQNSNLNSVSAMETRETSLKSRKSKKMLPNLLFFACLLIFSTFSVYSQPRPPRLPSPRSSAPAPRPHPKSTVQKTDERLNDSNTGIMPNTDEFVTLCGLDILIADLPEKYEWAAAQRACPEGWRLPTSDELKCICSKKGHIGGFSGNQYWTSNEHPQNNKAITYILGNCRVKVENMLSKHSVRCVRKAVK